MLCSISSGSISLCETRNPSCGRRYLLSDGVMSPNSLHSVVLSLSPLSAPPLLSFHDCFLLSSMTSPQFISIAGTYELLIVCCCNPAYEKKTTLKWRYNLGCRRNVEQIDESKETWRIKVKVIRLWKQPGYGNSDEIGSIEMILMDEEGTKIHASIRKTHIKVFNNKIQEHKCYLFTNFRVDDCSNKFMLCNNEKAISFFKSTGVFPCQNNDQFGDGLDIVSFSDIVNCKVVTKFPIDVIAEVASRGTIHPMTNKYGQEQIWMPIHLKDIAGIRLTCTLWNEHVTTINNFLDDANNVGRVVIVIQMAKLSIFSHEHQLSSLFFGTRIWLNSDMPIIKEYNQRCIQSEGEVDVAYQVPFFDVVQTHTQTDDWTNMDKTNLIDLPKIKEKTYRMVYGTIKALQAENRWYYLAHRKCSKKVQNIDEIDISELAYTNANNEPYHCKACKLFVSDVVPRFRVQVKVEDDSGEASLLLFDKMRILIYSLQI